MKYISAKEMIAPCDAPAQYWLTVTWSTVVKTEDGLPWMVDRSAEIEVTADTFQLAQIGKEYSS